MSSFFKSVKNTIKHWYVPAIVGILFIVVGVYLFTTPLETYFSLAVLFGFSFLISGIMEIVFSVSNRNEMEGWGWYLASGVFGTVMGLILTVFPAIAATTLPYFIGFTLMFRSFQGLGLAFDLKNYGVMKWGDVALLSILGIILSFILIESPIFTGFSLVAITASTFIVLGIYAIVLSVRLKKLKSYSGKISPELKDKIENLKKEYYDYLKKKVANEVP
ncbi:MAG: hypothetical protein DI598_14680 [Pseudopedobacter saltans]|uniref:HdeD family acid-resistance protein n=1 Tax=Pseudopedobacter saltans TaxID=151895 RepID=A0A2W5EP97_9SPHI|nr:MAG: hypothetical protein DI598_14680 [Pseudopedobacter saltans]